MKNFKKAAALFIAFALVITSSFVFVNLPVKADGNWWEEDTWEKEKLVELGAEIPTYNKSADQYEISTPEQLLYLSGAWSNDDTNSDGAPDAPCDGKYVLTADLDMSNLMKSIGQALTKASGKTTEGYMPPIATETSETPEKGGVRCAFFGDFDGQGHTISNIVIKRFNNKYAGLFGNIGYDYGVGSLKNLALVNIKVECVASAGLLVGGLYGDVDNVVVIGSLDLQEKTAGGLAGKIKKNENGNLGTARNCFVYCDTVVHGQGSENGAAGGITAANSDGGRVYNCIALGSITVEGEGADAVGGISGALKASEALQGSIVALRKIAVEDGINIGLLAGDYSGETGAHLGSDYVWEGTTMTGLVAPAHPAAAAFASIDAASLQSKSFYANGIGWDMTDAWNWVGADEGGYPLPAPFGTSEVVTNAIGNKIAEDLVVTEPVLRPSEPMTTTGYIGEPCEIAATLTLPEGVSAEKVTLFYGSDKDGASFKDSVELKLSGDGLYKGDFPKTDSESNWYYYLSATVGGKEITFPSDVKQCIPLQIVPVTIIRSPKHITVSPGETYDKIGINWITDEEGLDAIVRYREAGTSDWTEVNVEDITPTDLSGAYVFTTYAVTLSGLKPKTAYEYQAVTDSEGELFESSVASFTTLPDTNEFNFIAVSDLQSTNAEGYLPFLNAQNAFIKNTLGGTDFYLNLGDLTEGGSIPEWQYMFDTLSESYANTITAFTAGNHENKQDLLYSLFKGHTNQPGTMDEESIGDTTASFVVGDVCFVILNTDPYSGKEGADTLADKRAFYEAQKEWAKSVFEASGCKWRIIGAHAGLVQDDLEATEFIEKMCDELDVDLYFNGHIHDYYRITARDGAHAATGEGTTYITTSPMGRKFDDFVEGQVPDDFIDFQTGGVKDRRQYFTYVSVSDTGISVKSYQLSEAGDDTLEETFNDFTEIDGIELTESLSVKNGTYVAGTGNKTTTVQSGGTVAVAYWYIGGAVVLIAAVAIIIVVVQKKKKKKAETNA
ncbi:MAG: metallophosphoesterase family protein [Lachnospiraceae bacterium]|jgi:hypothetical protein|nr:metallophosphoesterase family protein [Lachnospiraceae bacterium]